MNEEIERPRNQLSSPLHPGQCLPLFGIRSPADRPLENCVCRADAPISFPGRHLHHKITPIPLSLFPRREDLPIDEIWILTTSSQASQNSQKSKINRAADDHRNCPLLQVGASQPSAMITIRERFGSSRPVVDGVVAKGLRQPKPESTVFD